MEHPMTTEITPSTPASFSLFFAQTRPPISDGDQTVGAETETQTSQDGIVKTDTVEDEDIDK